MPSPYHGIINWESDVWFHYDWGQPPYNPSSGVVRTYESTSDFTPSWSFITPVVYNGSYFSGNANATVQMDLYLNNILVHQTGIFTPSRRAHVFCHELFRPSGCSDDQQPLARLLGNGRPYLQCGSHPRRGMAPGLGTDRPGGFKEVQEGITCYHHQQIRAGSVMALPFLWPLDPAIVE